MYEGILKNEGKKVEEPYAFGYAYNEVITNKRTRADFILKFAIPCMVEDLNLEEFAFNYAIMQILSHENVKHEFIEYFFSGNWIKVEDETETD